MFQKEISMVFFLKKNVDMKMDFSHFLKLKSGFFEKKDLSIRMLNVNHTYQDCK